MNDQPTNHIFLIRPIHFRYNKETAEDNTFQEPTSESLQDTQCMARHEFDNVVNILRKNNVHVTVFDDTERYDTPDSIFPNNWISTHENGTIFLYPMFAPSRRNEVRLDIVDKLTQQFGFTKVIDWTRLTTKELFLEGTGSLVLDRKHKIAYCCASERSNLSLAKEWATLTNYTLVPFHGVDSSGVPIYHTNVMMNVAEHFALVCLRCINSNKERKTVTDQLIKTGKEIIDITEAQMNHFAGNMLELSGADGKRLQIMSQTAFNVLTDLQRSKIEQYATIVTAPIPVIEQNGGGSIRCMITEIFRPTTSLS